MPTTMPLNRFITFVKPYINLLAGAIAAFLIAKANVLGIPGLGEHGDELTVAIAGALAWLVTQGAAQLGDLKWLKGHQLQIVGDAQVQAALMTAQPLPAPAGAAQAESLYAFDENLPSDEEEFATANGAATRSYAVEHPGAAPDAEYDFDVEEFDDTAYGALLPYEDLPGDDEELASPPPDETNTPIQPSQVELQGASA